MIVAVVSAGCASAGFHEGRTTLGKEEQGYLRVKGSGKGSFERFWQSPNLQPWGLVQWQEERSWAIPEAPLDLLQSVRDELGRLNQRAMSGSRQPAMSAGLSITWMVSFDEPMPSG